MKKLVLVKDLLEYLREWPGNSPICLRVIELGEVQLTADLTGIDQYEDGSPMLIGELQESEKT